MISAKISPASKERSMRFLTVLIGFAALLFSTFSLAAPTFSLSKTLYTSGESIVLNFNDIQPSSGTHWIGIWAYPDAGTRYGPWNQQHNGGAGSLMWKYIGATTDGSIAFNSSGLSEGRYVAFLLADDAYGWLASPVFFAVRSDGNPPDEPGALRIDKSRFSNDDTAIFHYEGIAPNPTHWIGVWRFIDGPGTGSQDQQDGPWSFQQTNASTQWHYVTATSGQQAFDLSSFPPGRYAAFLLANDGYDWLALPVFFDITPAVDPGAVRVMQFNIWQEGTSVSGGYQGIIDTIVETGADIVTLSEVRNYNGEDFHAKVVASLQSRGLSYHSFKSGNDTAIVSRYPILASDTIGSFSKAVVEVDGVQLAVYAGHLDYTHYACYLPRGYGGGATAPTPTYEYGWSEIPSGPVTDVGLILQVNDASDRPASIARFVADAQGEIQQGRVVIMAGDFNEPSHLDWTVATRWLFDHNGAVVPWTSTELLEDGGFVDAYRSLYPDPVTHPGFTWPSDNPDKAVSQLTWAPKADERDRIDYVFYGPDPRITVRDGIVVGPSSSIVRNARVEETGEDRFLTPNATWPSDHKGVLMTFDIGNP